MSIIKWHAILKIFMTLANTPSLRDCWKPSNLLILQCKLILLFCFLQFPKYISVFIAIVQTVPALNSLQKKKTKTTKLSQTSQKTKTKWKVTKSRLNILLSNRHKVIQIVRSKFTGKGVIVYLSTLLPAQSAWPPVFSEQNRKIQLSSSHLLWSEEQFNTVNQECAHLLSWLGSNMT